MPNRLYLAGNILTLSCSAALKWPTHTFKTASNYNKMRLIQLLHHLFKTDELALKANYLVNDAHANTAPPSPTRSSPRQLLTDGDRDLRLISNSRSIKTKENRAATVAATAQWLGRGRLRARGPPGGPGFSQRERACALHILPSSSSCGPVMCFLT